MAQIDISAATREVRIDGTAVALGARAYDVLAYLDAHSDRVVSKAELLEQVWGGLAVEEGNLTVQISTLRKALGPKAIATVPGMGYKLAVEAKPDARPDGPALPDIPSLAVLPFSNLTAKPDQDYLVDGIVTELIAALTKVPGLFVIAATSSFAYRGRAVQLADVGRELGVRYVLEGSVQQAGTARGSRCNWWRPHGTVDLVGAFHRRARRHLRPSGPPDRKRRRRHRADLARRRSHSQPGQAAKDLRAYDLCLQVEPIMLFTSKPDEFTRAFALLDEAVARDPGYAYARALRVWAYTMAAGGRFISTGRSRPMCYPMPTRSSTAGRPTRWS
jgi:DNA-binding winged helix-turn-helix (wHTH) protein